MFRSGAPPNLTNSVNTSSRLSLPVAVTTTNLSSTAVQPGEAEVPTDANTYAQALAALLSSAGYTGTTPVALPVTQSGAADTAALLANDPTAAPTLRSDATFGPGGMVVPPVQVSTGDVNVNINVNVNPTGAGPQGSQRQQPCNCQCPNKGAAKCLLGRRISAADSIHSNYLVTLNL